MAILVLIIPFPYPHGNNLGNEIFKMCTLLETSGMWLEISTLEISKISTLEIFMCFFWHRRHYEGKDERLILSSIPSENSRASVKMPLKQKT